MVIKRWDDWLWIWGFSTCHQPLGMLRIPMDSLHVSWFIGVTIPRCSLHLGEWCCPWKWEAAPPSRVQGLPRHKVGWSRGMGTPRDLVKPTAKWLRNTKDGWYMDDYQWQCLSWPSGDSYDLSRSEVWTEFHGDAMSDIRIDQPHVLMVYTTHLW